MGCEQSSFAHSEDSSSTSGRRALKAAKATPPRRAGQAASAERKVAFDTGRAAAACDSSLASESSDTSVCGGSEASAAESNTTRQQEGVRAPGAGLAAAEPAISVPVAQSHAVFKAVHTSALTGGLCLMPYPSRQDVLAVRKAGGHAVVTLQKDEEGAQTVGKHCRELGMEWIHEDFWLLYHAKMQDEIMEGVHRAAALVKEGKNVVVHCTAGIHRTGMFTYCVLRTLGYTPKAAVASLKALRLNTYLRVGAHRVANIEKIVSHRFPHPLPEPRQIPDTDLPPVVTQKVPPSALCKMICTANANESQ